MTNYNPNVPTGLINLDVDYQNLQKNFQQLDNTYGVDHVKFSVVTNNGFHNQVTTPAQGSIPTTTTNPILFAFQQYTNLGVLQYSGGPSAAIPTPLTKKYSGATPITLANNATANIIDFVGVKIAIANVYAFNASTTPANYITNIATVFFNGTSLTGIGVNTGALQIGFTGSSSVLFVKNNSGSPINNVFWAIEFVEIQ